MAVTVNATFCATLVDTWVNLGVRRAFIAPGSRSTPLALACLRNEQLDTVVFHDERSASFAALGHGLRTHTPALVLCTSGTAATHFFAAVVEADLSAVPMILCTADRPPELWGRGAPQTIDQVELFGNKTRLATTFLPPDETDPASWRPLATQAWHCSTGQTVAMDVQPRPGPVHLNLSFRDPLVGTAGDLPPATSRANADPSGADDSPPQPDPVDSDQLAAAIASPRGVLVVGRHACAPADIFELAEKLEWPIISDHRSGCRTDHRLAMHRFDAVLRTPNANALLRPDVIIRIGEIVASKATSQWIAAAARSGTTVIGATAGGRRIDPEDVNSLTLDSTQAMPMMVDLANDQPDRTNSWAAQWSDIDNRAHATVEQVLEAERTTTLEIDVVRQALDAVASGGALVVSSSMPVRDLEWFGQPRADITVLANRGANGIDGVIATAIGVALTGTPTTCLIGDVAFLHDSTSLIALADRDIDLVVVVINNDGGGIFSFLPQHQLLNSHAYETLFGTPHGTDITALCQAHGLSVHDISSDWASRTEPGPAVVVARTERDHNLQVHERIAAAVAADLS